MSGVKRVFVEKKKPFAVNAKELLEEIGGYLWNKDYYRCKSSYPL